jgi:hypothetical protein
MNELNGLVLAPRVVDKGYHQILNKAQFLQRLGANVSAFIYWPCLA